MDFINELQYEVEKLRKDKENKEEKGINVNPLSSQLFITFAGLIGAGKTTAANSLAKELNVPIYHEKVDKRYLKLYYSNRKKYALLLQFALLTQRFNQQQTITWNKKQGGVQDRSLYEDLVFISMLKKEGSMNDLECEAYEELFNIMTTFMRQPDIIVYLNVEPEIALKRIQERIKESGEEREMEKEIKLEYLQNLKKEYDAFIASISEKITVINIDWNEFKDISYVVEKINGNLHKTPKSIFDWSTTTTTQ